MKKLDELYSCFESHLLDLDIERECHSEFIANVVEAYMSRLQCLWHVCMQYELDLREEVELEVVTMLRKKIYGHYNLDHFRNAHRQQKKFQ